MASNRLVVAVRKGNLITIFNYDDNSASWNTIGNPLNIEFTAEGDWDHALALSSDGSVIAVGDEDYDGYRGRVMIFSTHPEYGWTQLGSDIIGESGDKSGQSLALSSGGAVVAIGATGNSNKKGCARVFAFDTNNKWVITSADTQSNCVTLVSLNSVSLPRFF